jgi:hypothetical protein
MLKRRCVVFMRLRIVPLHALVVFTRNRGGDAAAPPDRAASGDAAGVPGWRSRLYRAARLILP